MIVDRFAENQIAGDLRREIDKNKKSQLSKRKSVLFTQRDKQHRRQIDDNSHDNIADIAGQ